MNSPLDNTNKIQVGSLTDECYKRIKQDILTGKLGWGERLNVINLAETYGISRSPVIKAIERLAMEQLVQIIPNVGSFVHIPTKEDIQEVTEIRLMLETTMCRLAYEKNKVKLLDELADIESIIDKVTISGNKISFEAFLDYDHAFHLTFPKYANNGRMAAYYDSIRNQIELFRTKTYYKTYIDLAIERHHGIIKALSEGQLDEAVCILHTHISEVEQEIIESIERSDTVKEYK